MNIVIPAAGRGQRFVDAGYKLPKPLIDVFQVPMLARVINNLGDGKYTIMVPSDFSMPISMAIAEHIGLGKDMTFYSVNGITDGAVCTILMAEKRIDSEEDLMIANSDQLVGWYRAEFFEEMNGFDAGILVFENSHHKWSYAECDDDMVVRRVAEKKVISRWATCGIYWWRHGSDFVKFAKQMIKKNIRVNNEFYTCPVFNEAIEAGLKVKAFKVNKMIGLGTPEDYGELTLAALSEVQEP